MIRLRLELNGALAVEGIARAAIEFVVFWLVAHLAFCLIEV